MWKSKCTSAIAIQILRALELNMLNKNMHILIYPWQLQKHETENLLTTSDSGFMEMFDCDVYGD